MANTLKLPLQVYGQAQSSLRFPADCVMAGKVNLGPAKVCFRDGSGGAHLHVSSTSKYLSIGGQRWKRAVSAQAKTCIMLGHDSSIACGGHQMTEVAGGSFLGSTNGFDKLHKKSHARSAVGIRASNSDFKQQGPSPGMPSRRRSLKKATPSRLGYHPLEDIPAAEKIKGLVPGERQLSSSEIARTIAEVDVDCIVFASVVQDETAVLGTDANYLVDHSGDLYLELDDGDEFLQNLQNDQTCSILIGFGKMDDVSLQNLIEEVDDGDKEAQDGPDKSEDAGAFTEEDIKFLNETYPGGLEEIMDTLSPESMGSLGAWGGPESLKWVHPWEFAVRLAESATTDFGREMDFPSRRLTITGVVRRATPEEELRIRDLWDDRFSDVESDAEDELSDNDEGDNIFVDDPQELAARASGSVPKGVVRAGVWMGEPIKSRSKERSSLAASGTNTVANSSTRDLDSGSFPSASDELVVEAKVHESSKQAGKGKEVEGAGGVHGFQVDGLDKLLGEARDGGIPRTSSSSAAEAEILDSSFDIEDSDGRLGKGKGQEEDADGSVGDWEDGAVMDISTNDEEGSVTWTLSSKDGSFTLEGFGPNTLEAFIGAGMGELGEGSIIEVPPGSGWGGEGDWDDGVEEEGSSSLYKVEILSIQLDSTSGLQEAVTVSEWSAARPDMLAHAAAGIMERANGLDRARQCMADLCERDYGFRVDEVSMVGIDHLGIDLRVRTGIELRTLRFPFLHPAVSERAAEKLLDELLRPRQAQARRASKRSRQIKRARGRP